MRKSFSGMMSSILTADRDARAGRAAGSVRVATSALEAVSARATIRDCIFSLTCGVGSTRLWARLEASRGHVSVGLSVAASVCWRSSVTRAFLNRSRGERRREGWMVQAWGHSKTAKWCIAAAAFARTVRRVNQHLSRACCVFDAALGPRSPVLSWLRMTPCELEVVSICPVYGPDVADRWQCIRGRRGSAQNPLSRLKLRSKIRAYSFAPHTSATCESVLRSSLAALPLHLVRTRSSRSPEAGKGANSKCICPRGFRPRVGATDGPNAAREPPPAPAPRGAQKSPALTAGFSAVARAAARRRRRTSRTASSSGASAGGFPLPDPRTRPPSMRRAADGDTMAPSMHACTNAIDDAAGAGRRGRPSSWTTSPPRAAQDRRRRRAADRGVTSSLSSSSSDDRQRRVVEEAAGTRLKRRAKARVLEEKLASDPRPAACTAEDLRLEGRGRHAACCAKDERARPQERKGECSVVESPSVSGGRGSRGRRGTHGAPD